MVLGKYWSSNSCSYCDTFDWFSWRYSDSAIGWGTYKKTKTQFGDMVAVLIGIVVCVIFYLVTSLVLIYMLGYDSHSFIKIRQQNAPLFL